MFSSGPVPPNAAELLMKTETSEMFAQLKELYDIIIIDAPPIGAVTDAQILAKQRRKSFYVVRQAYTFKGNLEIINDIVGTGKFSNLYIC